MSIRREAKRKLPARCTFWACVLGLFVLARPGVVAQVRFVPEYQLERDTVEIPFEYVQHEILVHVDVGSSKNLTFMFDTGASAPVLDKSLGLNGVHLADTVVQEAEGEVPAEAVLLDNLRLGPAGGGAGVRNISALVTDLSQTGRLLGRKIDGMLGITFMAGFVVEIDYEKHLLRFSSPRSVTLTQRTPDNRRTFLLDLTPLSPAHEVSSPLLSGRLPDYSKYDFLLDTGFGGYISVAQSVAQASKLLLVDTPRIRTVNYGVRSRFSGDLIHASYLTIGAIDLSGRTIQVDSRSKETGLPFGLAGNRFLQNYRVILDYSRLKLWLERVTDMEEPDESERRSLGMRLHVEGRLILVERVVRYSPAHRSGVWAGDQIVAVNGQALEDLPLEQALKLLTAPAPKVKLEMKHGVDPILGIGGEPYVLTLVPTSPLDWKAK